MASWHLAGRVWVHRKREWWIQVSLADQKADWGIASRRLPVSSSRFELLDQSSTRAARDYDRCVSSHCLWREFKDAEKVESGPPAPREMSPPAQPRYRKTRPGSVKVCARKNRCVRVSGAFRRLILEAPRSNDLGILGPKRAKHPSRARRVPRRCSGQQGVKRRGIYPQSAQPRRTAACPTHALRVLRHEAHRHDDAPHFALCSLPLPKTPRRRPTLARVESKTARAGSFWGAEEPPLQN